MRDGNNPDDMTRRIVLEERSRVVADTIVQMMPPDTTFMLITANVGENANLSYISNAQRESAIEMMRELLHRWDANQ